MTPQRPYLATGHAYTVYPVVRKDGCQFTVWAPEKRTMTLRLLSPGHPDKDISMQKDPQGYFTVFADGVGAGERYFYIPEGGEPCPDPASQHQPDGIHGPSQVVDQRIHAWQDISWRGRPLSTYIIYELHVGTFTPEGTFDAIIPRLDELANLGITAIELMPVAEFPGERNWGYDGVFLYAVQHNYGGPDGLKRLVDACHRRRIAVVLDVVYNHLGKEGNCLDRYGPYFSETYLTPWGKALNFDGPWSDGVRRFIIGNVLSWAHNFHLDGLRLDAVHEIYDRNAVSLWDELHHVVKEWELHAGKPFFLTAESDLNDPRVVLPPAEAGRGFHAQWLDDFHHALYVLLDPEGRRNYGDYGELRQLAKAYTDGFVFSGEYSCFRKRRHGTSSRALPGERFIVFNQNHDLPGNRPDGARLSRVLDEARSKLAAAVVLLSPYLPLLFMGEEYGDSSPFYFFSDYGQPKMSEELREQRKQQFAGFNWDTEAPDPQQPATWLDCILKWDQRLEDGHRQLLDWYRQLIALRKSHPLLMDLSRRWLRADLLGACGLAILRHSADHRAQLLILFNFSAGTLQATIPYPLHGQAAWTLILGVPGVPEQIVPDKATVLPPWSASVYAFNALSD